MKNNIKNAREKMGLTQKECADELGITLRAWQTYEQGVSEPKNEILCKIADMFNVTLDYLLGREPLPNPFADLDLPPESEQDVLAKYMSFPPEIRACLLDALRKLGAAADGETDEPEQPAAKSIAEDMADTVIKGEQMFSKDRTNKK